jgi:4-amino-4-deoxy-L-arabinose transferase-like glycosyltransferase
MTTITLVTNKPFFSRKLVLGITTAQVLLAGITLLSLALHLVNLQAIGDANTYYTAAVESMLKSWHNFFFVAAEPGGSVTVDKPPLGLWIEAAFAYTLGVSGVTVSLPNIIAGVLSVPLLYHLVKQYWGELAGLVAGLVLAVTPVAVATNRNNTMDGMLVFTLLLAAWAFIKATESGKNRWLFLGALLVGLGFNIKMLQAFLPLPVFYALYFFGSKTSWLRKVINLGVATVILLIVSLSWAVLVDLTPADQRPYIGGSENNTVMELILGHNGLSRLFNPRAASSVSSQNARTAVDGNDFAVPPVPMPGQGGIRPPMQGSQAPAGVQPPREGVAGSPNASPGGSPSAGGTPFSQETGSPSITRFFTAPLSKQMSWLLPFGLVSIMLVVFTAPIRVPLKPEHKALVLWGGWLLVCLIFFSFVEGIFHAYYVIMLAPALGAVVGGGLSQMWRWQTSRRWANGFLVLTATGTLIFQIFTAFQNGIQSAWIYLPIAVLLAGVGVLLVKALRPIAYLTILVSMLVIPLIWTTMTVLDEELNVSLPTAYDPTVNGLASSKLVPGMNGISQVDEALISYLEANTQDAAYLAAVPDSRIGSSLVLETGRPVLYMGGFSGGDPVIDADGLSEMVTNGELRYVIVGGRNGNQKEIASWLASSCTVVPQFSQSNVKLNPIQLRPGGSRQGLGEQATTLYQCG